MNNILKRSLILVSVAVFFLVSGLAGCSSEGPAEKAGKKIDASVDSIKKSVEELSDKVSNKGTAQKIGEKIDDSVEVIKEKAEEIGDKISGKGPAEKAGEKIDETIEKVKEGTQSEEK